ncbi:plasmid partitioning protein RepB C-terminal domain-containing protein [Mesorhizobium sp. Cs1299R1N3]|uniref:plasmid partitioning protein RepB C-terminal domain-containing protein n=1 Tax=Mesorhizobium sp. Cs1299R1N3 TaxID=3015173 RepID=UPI00301D5092
MVSSKRRLTREAAHKVLRDSNQRHARNIVADQPGSKEKLFAPRLLATYEAECRRKRDFIREVAETEQRLGRLVEALRLIMSDMRFHSLLASEGLPTIPKLLAQRLQATRVGPAATPPCGEISPCGSEAWQPAHGICAEVLDRLRDCPVKVKIFGLLRHVLPARQLEIARLMVAMDRVTFTYVKMLVALTPQRMLVKDFHPTMIANLTQDQYRMMEPEVSALGAAFLSAFERRGLASLELGAGNAYFHRLMDNSKIVRYLAHTFPGNFEEFHELSSGYAFSNSHSFVAHCEPRAGPARPGRGSCRTARVRWC